MSHSKQPTYDFLDDDAEDDTLPRQKTVAKMRGHVLIAEDDAPLRDMLETILRLEGHHVTTVPSADAMLRAVSSSTHGEQPFDVVVTDVRMPGASGLDVVERLRADGFRLPIIVMTAFPDEGIRTRAHALDTLLIAKPFSLETICFAIQSLVRQCAL